MNNLKNRYSFYTLKNSQDFMDLYSKNTEKKEKITQKYYLPTNTQEETNFFTYKKIYQEYSYKSGISKVFHDLEKNKLELLYNRDKDMSNFFDLNGVYLAKETEKGLKKLFYITKDEFLYKSKINDKYNCLEIIKDYKFTDITSSQRYFDRFNKINIQYKMISNYIPALNFLKSILQTAYKFIATRTLSEEMQLDLIQNYMVLTKLGKSCHGSVKLVSDLVFKPYDIDLRNFCCQLEQKINNIEYLLDIYLDKDKEK